MVSSPKLPLEQEERSRLRSFKIKLNEIPDRTIEELSNCLQCSFKRARYIRALAIFQSVSSIGPKVAGWMIDLGYYSLDEVKNESGSDLINRLELMYGYWMDPCVEDSLRCIVHHANHEGNIKRWHDFSLERKKYRKQFGYPSTRPKLAWTEVYANADILKPR
ncbi:Pathogenicity locus [Seinonella peptonophila]|uniref:Pathogenicity locus n=1 Tax=Seinonella peptonophila TaxID=112248 RepID=A0A1M5B1C6_9BACL|nr:helix-hairpin-helix domain-containing protein [Seinonella peptonophila]SHF36259.1 Pathogenicity locus [Seinonella peptonophila]